jgi:lipoyl(octanoyl) transferase
MALNVSLNPEPFERINVCGHPGLAVTRLADHCGVSEVGAAAAGLTPHLLRRLGLESDPLADIGAAGRLVAQ